MNMFTSIAPSSTTAVETTWDRVWSEFESITAQRDAFYEGVMAPLNARYPAHPGFEPVRVGTSRGTGEPLMHTFYPQDLELEGWHPYLENAGWQQARNRWLSYTRERDAFQAATNYDALEEQADELTSVAADAQHDMLCTPAPHLDALCRKLEIVFGEDGPDLNSDGALRDAILADTHNLLIGQIPLA